MNMITLHTMRLVKKYSWVLFFIMTLSAHSNVSIVFVHLGDTLPSYLPCAVEQARLFNPEATIYLIANQRAVRSVPASLYTAKIVTCESLTCSAVHQQFIESSTLDTEFRDGFWRKTTERFFYIDELLHTYNLTNVFHLEYDNMLYVNLDELLPLFKKQYKGIAAVFDTDTRCVPSFMYFATPAAASCLVEFMVKQLPSGREGRFVLGFDMHSIGRYRKVYSSEYINTLPVIPTEYAEYDEFQKQVETPYLFCNNLAIFNSIFDAAALGQYLGGIDPRNGPSTPGFVNKDCVFDASRFNYVWIKDAQGRKIPYLAYHGKRYRINNLHIHSKQLEKFRS